MNLESEALYHELVHAPLLVGVLPEADVFDRSTLRLHPDLPNLNFDQKLGHLYEDALENVIKASESLDCIARGLQIFDANGRTMGELDFLIYDRVTKKHIHLELAVKFYLAVRESDGSWRYPGPDPRDNWQRKLRHLREHQLGIAHTHDGRRQITSQFEIREIECHQLVYGRVFYPTKKTEPPRMEAMSHSAQTGHWLEAADLVKHFQTTETIRVIPKHLWPLNLTKENRNLFEPVTVQELSQTELERCTMIATEKCESPYFLVPRGWPTPT